MCSNIFKMFYIYNITTNVLHFIFVLWDFSSCLNTFLLIHIQFVLNELHRFIKFIYSITYHCRFVNFLFQLISIYNIQVLESYSKKLLKMISFCVNTRFTSTFQIPSKTSKSFYSIQNSDKLVPYYFHTVNRTATTWSFKMPPRINIQRI